MKVLPAAILSISLLCFPLFSYAADSVIIAKVGESEVKAEDIKPFLDKLPLREQLQLEHDPAALNDFVRRMIIQQLVYKEALSKRWEQQSQVAAQLEQLRQQAITQSYLQSLATPPQDYPSQSDLQTAYESLKKGNALLVPKQYHLAQIYIACPNGADKSIVEKAQEKVDSVMKALKGGGEFSAVAKSQSDEQAAAQRGGDLGWLPENQIQPEIRSAVATLSKGGTTEAIRTNDGWHILKLVEVKEPYTASLDEVKTAIANEMRKQRAQVLAKAYLAKLLQQNPVTLNEIAVSKLIDIKGN